MDTLIAVANTIEDFGAEEWRAVSTGTSLYASAPWHRFLEADPSYDVWYVTARRPDGTLLGVLPVHLHAGGPRGGVDHFYEPRRLFGGAGGEQAVPTLLIGGRAGYETDLLLQAGLGAAERGAALAGLVGRARELARAWSADGAAALYLTADAAGELAPVFGDGEPLLTDAGAAIALHGLATFDDYLATLSPHRRRRVSRELRDFRAGGYDVRVGRLSDGVELAAGLLAQLHRRHGHGDTPELLAFHLAQQAEHLDAHSRMLICEDRGRPIGFLLVYEWDGVWYARAAGVADGMRGSSVFFNLVYYVAIAHALERGIHRYDIGPSSLKTKLLRGAQLTPRWSLTEVADLTSDAAQRLDEWDAELLAAGHDPAAREWSRCLGAVPVAA